MNNGNEISLKFDRQEFAAMMGALRLASMILHNPSYNIKEFMEENWTKEERYNILSHTMGVYSRIIAGHSIEEIFKKEPK